MTKTASLKGDVNYCINHKIPIFNENKSNLKLRKILQICLRSFVNPHPGVNFINVLRANFSYEFFAKSHQNVTRKSCQKIVSFVTVTTIEKEIVKKLTKN